MPKPAVNASRPCPFCGEPRSRFFGRRDDRVFVRCDRCRSIFRDFDRAAFEALHAEAFEDDDFIQRQLHQHAAQPSHAVWRSIRGDRTAGRFLEIGPGTGHLMAAASQAGWTVAGVEHSRLHREFIGATWGLGDVFGSLEEVPVALKFDLIALVNVLEHAFDVDALLGSLRDRLAPEGAIFVSAPNADCLVSDVMGTWWSMYKQVDHVSIPTREGLRLAGQRAGLRARRVWSTELPFETPLSFLVALRDRSARERPASAGTAARTTSVVSLKDRGMRWVNEMNPRWEPINRLMGVLGRAGSVKVTYGLADASREGPAGP